MTKTVDQIYADLAAENRSCEAQRCKKKLDPKEVAYEAERLWTWSKGKPIRRLSSDSTFWSSGKWMTKVDYAMADAIVAAGLGTLKGDSKTGGSILTIRKPS